MQKIRKVARHLFGIAEKVHTALWLAEICGVSAAVAFVGGAIKLRVSQHLDWFVIGVGFIVSVAVFTLPRLLYGLYLRSKARKLVHTIEFNFLPALLTANGWKQAYPKEQLDPKAIVASDAPVVGSVYIEAPDGFAYDYLLPRNVSLADRLVFAAKFTPGTMIFTLVELSSRDGKEIAQKWIKYEPSKATPHPTKGYDDREWTLPIAGKPLQNGWRQFDIYLPNAVAQTWARQGFSFKRVLNFRVRANLGISPIKIYESH